MRRILALATSVLLAGGASPAPAQSTAELPKGRWTSLFNGKDLDGWVMKFKGSDLGENYKDTFRVEDGVLKVSYDKYTKFDGEFGHLFYKQPFSNYRLRIEYRFVGDQCPGGPGWAYRNNGVMIHSQKPETMRKDQEFPASIEVQFLGGPERGTRHTGNVCTPGTHIVMGGKLIKQHCNDSTSPTLRGDQWVTIEVEARADGTIKHFVNGDLVLQYEKPQLDPDDPDGARLIRANNGEKLLTGGYIALQAETAPAEFRKVEIMPLDD
jgi:hypothetical protein